MKSKTLIVLVVLANTYIGAWAQARIPEPDAILYGRLTIDGEPQDADSGASVIVRVPGVTRPVGHYHMGDDDNAGDNYVLRISLDSLTDGTGRIVFRDTDTSIGQTVTVYVENAGRQMTAGTFLISGRGTAVNMALNAVDGSDSDGDGISDAQERQWGLNPYSSDTDGDGISDSIEVCYDGDCSNYNPYDPATGMGTDPNANSQDSDRDGMGDAWEIVYLLNPLADDRFADYDGDGYTNWEEFSRGSRPDDKNSIPQPDVLYVDDDAQLDPGPGDPGLSDPNEDGTIDHPYDSIQEAVNQIAANNIVVVADGIYSGPGNRDIDLMGKSIVVMTESWPGTCIIDCQGTPAEPHRGFIFQNGEDPNSVIYGFTITNGYADDGGAIYCSGSSPTLLNCFIVGNTAQQDGGGLFYTDAPEPHLVNVTIAGNHADGRGGALFCDSNSGPIVLNSILWANTAVGLGQEIYLKDAFQPELGSIVTLSYSSVDLSSVYKGNFCALWPSEVIAADPLFAAADANDYHLRSQAGRWDPNSQSWVLDAVISTCIDAGDPNSDWTAELWLHGKRINLGAYGGTPQASRSSGDTVKGEDLFLLTDSWCRQGMLLAGDANGDGVIDFRDFAIFAEMWRQTTAP